MLTSNPRRLCTLAREREAKRTLIAIIRSHCPKVPRRERDGERISTPPKGIRTPQIARKNRKTRSCLRRAGCVNREFADGYNGLREQDSNLRPFG